MLYWTPSLIIAFAREGAKYNIPVGTVKSLCNSVREASDREGPFSSTLIPFHVREDEFQNPGDFCFWNPQSGKFLHVESGILGLELIWHTA